MTKERLLDIFIAYVGNDYNATGDSEYIKEALSAAGAGPEDYDELGLGWLNDCDESPAVIMNF